MGKSLPPPDDNDIVHLVEELDGLFVHAATALRFNADKRFLVDVPSRESVIAKRCRELMIASLSQNMAKIEDEATQNVDVADLEGRVEVAFPDEFRYAYIGHRI